MPENRSNVRSGAKTVAQRIQYASGCNRGGCEVFKTAHAWIAVHMSITVQIKMGPNVDSGPNANNVLNAINGPIKMVALSILDSVKTVVILMAVRFWKQYVPG